MIGRLGFCEWYIGKNLEISLLSAVMLLLRSNIEFGVFCWYLVRLRSARLRWGVCLCKVKATNQIAAVSKDSTSAFVSLTSISSLCL